MQDQIEPQAQQPWRKKLNEHLFEYSGESIFVVDPRTLDILDVNENAARRLGYDKKDLCRLGLADIQSFEDTPNAATLAWQSDISQTIFYECDYVCKSGDKVPVEVSCQLIHYGRYEVMLNFVRDISRRRAVEAEREQLIHQLEQALNQVKTLSGLLPICANCKKILDDEGDWVRVEAYVQARSDAEFSHGICPDCMQELYPEYYGDSGQQDTP